MLGDSLFVIDSFVCVADDYGNPNLERIANPEERHHCNRPTRFDLLPMPRRESERNHVLLAVAPPPAEFFDSLAKGLEEFGVIYHAATFTCV